MDTEEVIVKMGFDTHGVSIGAQKMSDIMGQSSGHVAEHFVHAESQGKAFKKLLHEIADVSPLMGNAFRLAMDPIAGLMMVISSGIKMVINGFEESSKRAEELGEKIAKHQIAIAEARDKGTDAFRKQNQTEAEAEQKRVDAFKSAQERAAYDAKVHQAKMESGGDEEEFLKRKLAIDKAEEARIKKEGSEKQEERLDLFAPTEGQLQGLEKQKVYLKELNAEYEKALKESEALKAGAHATPLSDIAHIAARGLTAPGGFAGALAEGDLERQAKLQEAAEKAEKLKQDRLKVAEYIRQFDEKEDARKARVKELDASQNREPGRALEITKKLSDDEEKIVEARRKKQSDAVKDAIEEAKAVNSHNQVKFLTEKIAIEENAKREAEAAGDRKAAMELETQLRKDNLALASAQKDQALEQAKLDRDIAHTQKRRRETESAPFMPTLQELANSAPWQRDILFDTQKQIDKRTMQMGMAFGQKHAGEAQELERLKDEAKRALFVEGPDSTRFKEDLKKIDSLKKGLATAGLQTSDDRLESIDKHMADLVDKASKEGLIVQPVNGP